MGDFMSLRAAYIGLVRKDLGSDYWLDFPDVPGCIVGAEELDALRAKAQGFRQISRQTWWREAKGVVTPDAFGATADRSR